VALSARYLTDKSALARMRHPEVRAVLEPLILGGAVATCGVIELEVLFSAVTTADLVSTRRTRASAFPRLDMTEADFRRAEDVMEALAQAGKHRAAGIPDLLIAAVAERAGVTVLHYDEDFDHIASVTRQPMQWVLSRGSVP